MAELGQTDDPKALVPGEPEVISSDLGSLVDPINVADDIGSTLGTIDPAGWVGDAATSFRSVFAEEPPKWGQAAEAVGQGGEQLANYADILNWGQGEAQRAIELYHQARAASRAAKAQYDAQRALGPMMDGPMTPFEDPGAPAMAEAQQILDAARKAVAAEGGIAAMALGMTHDEEGRFQHGFGEQEFGAENRQTQRRFNPETGQWEDVDPGGWQTDENGNRSYQNTVGDEPADKLMHDGARELFDSLGIDLPGPGMLGIDPVRHEVGDDVEVAGGEFDVGAEYGDMSAGASGSGSVLGAGAGAYAEVTEDGFAAGANAEAYLAKGEVEGEFDTGMGVSGSGSASGFVGGDANAEASVDALGAQASAEAFVGARGDVEGEMNFGDHASVSASGEAMAGAEASADASVGLTGADVSAEAFAGAKASGDVGGEVAGVGAGVNGEAWAGVGASADAQFGMGDDGKFHIGASAGAALGVGGKVGFDVSVDPGGVVDAATSAGEAVSGAGQAVGDAVGGAKDKAGDAISSVGNALGF
ncbi:MULTISPECIES: putative T7SS-secreted protein [Prauserella salsuginis group]|uniref:T7SS-secreted protein n=2 Tax=Prauserella salsuginis group TaxID=2893672 RepID=A0ABW6GA50_9PSEU|nr:MULTISPECIES: hypothetical protein [Prauserella salsuginis group]MBB3665298.1 hypothetical protein [Prauserella sediminis]MCR3723067.1 hypothetical protein [Prauserella flava]MCR3732558.1 hypothetical protein [Prauserella salsuginis]